MFAPFLQEYCITPPVSVRIIVYNANGNYFSCKFSCILGLGAFRPLPSQGSAALGGVAVGVWRMVKAWPCSRSAFRLSLRRWLLAPNIGRGVTPLPSSLRRSFSVEMVARWWWLLCSGAFFLRLSCWGLWLSVLLCWGWLYTVVYLSVFNRARN